MPIRRLDYSRGTAYDNLHRPISRGYPTTADNVAFAYDLLDRRSQANFADVSHTVAYVWDAVERLTSTTTGGKTLANQYDPAGSRMRPTSPATPTMTCRGARPSRSATPPRQATATRSMARSRASRTS